MGVKGLENKGSSREAEVADLPLAPLNLKPVGKGTSPSPSFVVADPPPGWGVFQPMMASAMGRALRDPTLAAQLQARAAAPTPNLLEGISFKELTMVVYNALFPGSSTHHTNVIRKDKQPDNGDPYFLHPPTLLVLQKAAFNNGATVVTNEAGETSVETTPVFETFKEQHHTWTSYLGSESKVPLLDFKVVEKVAHGLADLGVTLEFVEQDGERYPSAHTMMAVNLFVLCCLDAFGNRSWGSNGQIEVSGSAYAKECGYQECFADAAKGIISYFQEAWLS